MTSALSWLQINERLLQIERSKETTDEMKREYNKLLDMGSKLAGVLVRRKYEVAETKKEGSKRKGKKRKGANVGTIQSDLAGETPQERSIMEVVGDRAIVSLFPPHTP